MGAQASFFQLLLSSPVVPLPDCKVIMGCGSSARPMGLVLRRAKTAEGTLLEKPVQGVKLADLAQRVSVDGDDVQRIAVIVQGLADAATSIMTTNPLAAAGLAL